MEDFWTIVQSVRKSAEEAGVTVVTGDTKVVEKGKADRLYVNTSGIGRIRAGVDISPNRVRVGDRILLSGSIGDHGIAIMAKREGLEFRTQLVSDTAPLHRLVSSMLEETTDIHVLRDPTRGGLASTLNEIAGSAGAGIQIDEQEIPVKAEVQGACEILGLDPLYIANEGKLVAFVPVDHAEAALRVMRSDPLGQEARIIGEVVAEHPARVVMRTIAGGSRVVDMISGEQLPRIC